MKNKKIILTAFLAKLMILLVFILANSQGLDFIATDTRIHDHLMRWRNTANPEQPLSQDVILVGIDDKTNKELGRFGTGPWKARLPFIRQLSYLPLLQPKSLAYDILFIDDVKDSVRKGKEGFWQNPLVAKETDAFLKEFRENGYIEDIQNYPTALENITTMSALVSSSILETSFSNLIDKAPTKIFSAYFFPDKNNRKGHWTQEEILGDDLDDLNEDNGLILPLLRDVSIPLQYLKESHDDFEFNKNRVQLPSPSFVEFTQMAYVDVPRDSDGVVRKVPLFQGLQYSFQDKNKKTITRQILLPSISFLTALEALDISLQEINLNQNFQRADGKDLISIYLGSKVILRPPNRDEIQIPIDSQGRMYLDYVAGLTSNRKERKQTLASESAPKDRFDSLSFSDFQLHDDVKKKVEGKSLFVGLTYTGNSDLGPTALSDKSPLVLVHMTAASNILTQTFIEPISVQQRLFTLVVLTLILTTLSFLCGPKRFTVFAFLLFCVYAYFVYYNIYEHLYFLSIIAPLTLIALCFFAETFVYYLFEAKDKKRIRGMFSTMVSGDVLQYMEDNPGTFSLTGELREATMFFSDVAGFTSISETLTPAQLSELLNEYLTPMTDIIQDSHGYVDKYEGDAIMAEWGVPFQTEDHAYRACMAAIDQQKKLAEIRPLLKEKYGHELTVRMGINTGNVSAGNMGSAKRFSYTVMGDAVNQAARFEPINKDYGTDIIMGESTYEMVKGSIESRLLDKIVVKGKTVPIKVYEVIAAKGEIGEKRAKVVKLYEKALTLHWERKFEEALLLLDEALTDQSDQACLNLHLRIHSYITESPDENWQGEFVRTSKD